MDYGQKKEYSKELRKKGLTLYKKECLACEKEFETYNNRKIYCSNKCCIKINSERVMKKWREKRDLSFIEEKRKCKNCDKEFIWCSSMPQQLYCSAECCKEFGKNKLIELSKGIVVKGNGQYWNFYRLRFEVFKRDNFTCQYCGRNVKEDKIKLHIDHIHPNKKGGLFIAENLITSCSECNLGKRDVLLTEKALIEPTTARSHLNRV